jgi:hypothetical protein
VPRRPPVALALLAALTACSSGASGRPTGLTVPPVNGLSAKTLIACRALAGLLPEQLASGVERRAVTPASDTTSAYGDPAITVRCGVPVGSDRDDPYTFNDVRWALHDSGASRTWTTLGRSVNVEVVVPDSYSSQAELVGTVSLAVKRAS